MEEIVKLTKPDTVRVISFIDGQNLFRQAMRCFPRECYWPNYEPIKISEEIGLRFPDKKLVGIRFYTGVPPLKKSRLWHWFWKNKLECYSLDPRFASYTRTLAYHIEGTVEIAREKGVDVQMARDIIDLFRDNEYDVALLFTQDRDLAGVVEDLWLESEELGRWVYVECAYPDSPSIPRHYRLGIPNCEWITINKDTYLKCIDPNDYRPPPLPRADKLFDE